MFLYVFITVQSFWEERGGVVGKERRVFNLLTAWWMKLLYSLVEEPQRLWHHLPKDSRLKKLCDGWVELPTMLTALLFLAVVVNA